MRGGDTSCTATAAKRTERSGARRTRRGDRPPGTRARTRDLVINAAAAEPCDRVPSVFSYAQSFDTFAKLNKSRTNERTQPDHCERKSARADGEKRNPPETTCCRTSSCTTKCIQTRVFPSLGVRSACYIIFPHPSRNNGYRLPSQATYFSIVTLYFMAAAVESKSLVYFTRR